MNRSELKGTRNVFGVVPGVALSRSSFGLLLRADASCCLHYEILPASHALLCIADLAPE